MTVVNLEFCFVNDPRLAKDAFYNCNICDKTRLCCFSAEGRVSKIPSNNLRSSTSNSRSSRAPSHASRRSIRRSVSSTSLGSMAGKDGDHIDDELSGEISSEHSSALTENIIRKKAVNKVIFAGTLALRKFSCASSFYCCFRHQPSAHSLWY